jgi:cytochrome P450
MRSAHDPLSFREHPPRANDPRSAAATDLPSKVGGNMVSRKDHVMTMSPTQAIPAARAAHIDALISDLDPYSDAALIEPWDIYRKLQELGPAVWLPRYQMFALTRYDSVMRALKDAGSFSSASGVMMNDDMNQVLRGNTLCSDGDEHRRLRRLIAKPLTATALDLLKSEIASKAERLVDRLVAKRQFCAIAELAAALPVDIVASAIGLPEQGRERMLIWAEQMFNCFGPLNDRSRGAFPVLQEMMHYATTQAVRGKLKPGSWAEGVIDAVDRGEIDEAIRPVLMIDYMGPSLDTTIYAIGSGVWLFAKHPEEWRKVCEDAALVGSAINEIVRMESPVQGFSRLLTRDYEMDGTALPAGARAIAFYGAANRDPRKFPDPGTFDVMRSSADQLAFGWGPHVCVGQQLAKLEMAAIFRALASRVRRFHIEEEVRGVNNILRGFSRLMVSVE